MRLSSSRPLHAWICALHNHHGREINKPRPPGPTFDVLGRGACGGVGRARVSGSGPWREWARAGSLWSPKFALGTKFFLLTPQVYASSVPVGCSLGGIIKIGDTRALGPAPRVSPRCHASLDPNPEAGVFLRRPPSPPPQKTQTHLHTPSKTCNPCALGPLNPVSPRRDQHGGQEWEQDALRGVSAPGFLSSHTLCWFYSFLKFGERVCVLGWRFPSPVLS